MPSSTLVPAQDPTLLFTNAGMVQFKDMMTGLDAPDFPTAASVQRCVRAGGKHNDLENVGYTTRHLTFFEMLGNFSFGAYFKSEAIEYAWEFLTQVLLLPAERLWITVHETDDEAAALWADKAAVPPDRIIRLGDADNFWAMGSTGPCGPCSEIFYDHGAEVAGGPPGSAAAEGDRYVEIWNLVFMQYERSAEGRRTALSKPCVDTGMGLERICAVVQKVHSSYETDLFAPLLAKAADMAKIQDEVVENISLRVITDHIRSIAFLLADGVLPDNAGRGYVLRRIIRRALRHAQKIGARQGLLGELVQPLVEKMGGAYPKLAQAAGHIKSMLTQEEALFSRTLDQGLAVLEDALRNMTSGQTEISGRLAFQLYDTYGFPPDLTADLARERGLRVNMSDFDKAMAEQRKRARGASRFGETQAGGDLPDADMATDFIGYDETQAQADIQLLYRHQGASLERTDALAQDEIGVVVLDHTPFYAEAGGQAGDSGHLAWQDGCFVVTNTTKSGSCHLHHGHVEKGNLTASTKVNAEIARVRRQKMRLNHSATHLLHAALRKALGEQVEQKGSLVEAGKIRFDFSHATALTQEELAAIEACVNNEIRLNTAITTEIMPLDVAKEKGAASLFGEKYDDQVRVLTMGDGFSMELCGGTHANQTGDIGVFRIISESSIAAHVRRIEAITGQEALAWSQQSDQTMRMLQGLLKAERTEVVAKVMQLQEQQKSLQKSVQQLSEKLATKASGDLIAQTEQLGDIRLLAVNVGQLDKKATLVVLDDLKKKLGSAVILLAAETGNTINLTAGVTQDLTSRIKANELVQEIGALIGAKGGGRVDMAQAGGGQMPEKLPEALAAVKNFVQKRLG